MATDLVPTGVAGLDQVLRGGLARGSFFLVQGDPGSGKTTLALQFLISRAQAGDRALYVSITESRRDLENACASHGWSLDAISVCDLTHSAANLGVESDESVFHPADTDLADITRSVLSVVEQVDPEHVVFDGLSELRLLSGDALRYRRQLLMLKEFFAQRGTTVFLLDDQTAPFGVVKPESLVGGNVVLERQLPAYGDARRRLNVTKLRGADFREGYHDYDIQTGGIVVYPRLVAEDHSARFAERTWPSEIPNLDAMLHGGLSSGTTTLFLGPAGAGKSTVAMQFSTAAARRGAKSAIYIFDESLRTVEERSDKLCLGKVGGLRSFMDEGILHVQPVNSAEMSAGAFAHEVRRAVDAGAEIVVIDSLNGYLHAMREERSLTTHLHELFAYLNNKGVLTIVVVAQHGMVVGGAAGSDVDVSYLADSVLLFRYFEADGEISQAISVFKKRTGSHERTLRELSIEPDGVHVGAPLRAFRGIMSGIPQYIGKTANGEPTPEGPVESSGIPGLRVSR